MAFSFLQKLNFTSISYILCAISATQCNAFLNIICTAYYRNLYGMASIVLVLKCDNSTKSQSSNWYDYFIILGLVNFCF